MLTFIFHIFLENKICLKTYQILSKLYHIILKSDELYIKFTIFLVIRYETKKSVQFLETLFKIIIVEND